MEFAGELEGLLEKKVLLHTDRLRQVYEQNVVGADDRLRRDQGSEYQIPKCIVLVGYLPGKPKYSLKAYTLPCSCR